MPRSRRTRPAGPAPLRVEHLEDRAVPAATIPEPKVVDGELRVDGTGRSETLFLSRVAGAPGVGDQLLVEQQTAGGIVRVASVPAGGSRPVSRVLVRLDGAAPAAGGNDTLVVRDLRLGLRVEGGPGDDVVVILGGGSATLVGGDGDDDLQGGDGNDVFERYAGEGRDTLTGGAGRDRLVAASNADFALTNTALTIESVTRTKNPATGVKTKTVTATTTLALDGLEEAVLTAGAGDNLLDARAFSGDVTLRGGDGEDTLVGGAGTSRLIGGSAREDRLEAGAGPKTEFFGGETGGTVFVGRPVKGPGELPTFTPAARNRKLDLAALSTDPAVQNALLDRFVDDFVGLYEKAYPRSLAPIPVRVERQDATGDPRAGLKDLLKRLSRDAQVPDLRWMAYLLATAQKESQFVVPRDEGGWEDTAYAKPVGGKYYYGRGWAQLTWHAGYKDMGERLGVDLANNPALANTPDVSYRILTYGVLSGFFNDVNWVRAEKDELAAFADGDARLGNPKQWKGLAAYLGDANPTAAAADYTAAREIVNFLQVHPPEGNKKKDELRAAAVAFGEMAAKIEGMLRQATEYTKGQIDDGTNHFLNLIYDVPRLAKAATVDSVANALHANVAGKDIPLVRENLDDLGGASGAVLTPFDALARVDPSKAPGVGGGQGWSTTDPREWLRRTLEDKGVEVVSLTADGVTPAADGNLLLVRYRKAAGGTTPYTLNLDAAGGTGFGYLDDRVNGFFDGTVGGSFTAPGADFWVGIDLVGGQRRLFVTTTSQAGVGSLSVTGAVSAGLSIKSLADVTLTGEVRGTIGGGISFEDVDGTADGKLDAGRLVDGFRVKLGGSLVLGKRGDTTQPAALSAKLPVVGTIDWTAKFSATWDALTGKLTTAVDLTSPGSPLDIIRNLAGGLFKVFGKDVLPLPGGLGTLLGQETVKAGPVEVPLGLTTKLGLPAGFGTLLQGATALGNIATAGLQDIEKALQKVHPNIDLLPGRDLSDPAALLDPVDKDGVIDLLIRGEKVDLIRFGLEASKDWSVDATLFEMKFPIPPALVATLKANLNAYAGYTAYLGLGADTTGFYLDPNTRLGVRAGIRFGLAGGVSLAGILGVEASVGAGLSLEAGVKVNDPDPSDGAIYFDELYNSLLGPGGSFLQTFRFYAQADVTGHVGVKVTTPWPLPDITVVDETFRLGKLWDTNDNKSVKDVNPRGTYRVRPLASDKALDLESMVNRSTGVLTLTSPANEPTAIRVNGTGGTVNVTWYGRGLGTVTGIKAVKFVGGNLADRFEADAAFDRPVEADGGAGPDVLIGGAADDTLRGGLGEDELTGGGGADLADGGDGHDTLAGGVGADTLLGGAGAGRDKLDGGLGDDRLDGGDGDDRLDGGAGADELQGGAGADDLRGDAGNDRLDGGTGEDRLDGGHDDDTLAGGSEATDLIVYKDENGNTVSRVAADLLDGGPGRDYLAGGAGNDFLFGGPGDDVADGRTGNDFVAGDEGADTLFGGDGNDRLDGGPDDDLLAGGNADDTLNGGAGTDALFGDDHKVRSAASGRDRFEVELGAGEGAVGDAIDGGPDRDYLVVTGPTRYSATPGTKITDGKGDEVGFADVADDIRIRFDPAAREFTAGWRAAGDAAAYQETRFVLPTAVDAVIVQGRGGDDLLAVVGTSKYPFFLDGGEGNDIVQGGAGSDTLVGGGGADAVRGGAGHDVLYGGSGFATLDATDGGDSLDGGAGDDAVNGGPGNDTLTGGDGRDVLQGDEGDDYLFAGPGLVGDIMRGGKGRDTLEGGDGADVLSGGDDPDWLFGGGSLDVLDGGDGNDTLQGGTGRDILFGGKNDDTLEADGGPAPEAVTPEYLALLVGYYREYITSDRGRSEAQKQAALDRLDTALQRRAGTRTPAWTEKDETLLMGELNYALFSRQEAVLRVTASDLALQYLGRDEAEEWSAADEAALKQAQTELAAINLNKIDAGLPLQQFLTDNLQGGYGNDTLVGSKYSDILSGDEDDDILDQSQGDDALFGGSGNDTYRVRGTDGPDVADFKFSGDDPLSADDDGYQVVVSIVDGVTGKARLDLPKAGNADIESFGVDLLGGDDRVTFGGLARFYRVPVEGVIRVDGGAGNDVIDAAGYEGKTVLLGGADDDVLTGGTIGDTVSGGPGNDLLAGGPGNDLLEGGPGPDTLVGGGHNDRLFGDAEADPHPAGIADRDYLFGDDEFWTTPAARHALDLNGDGRADLASYRLDPGSRTIVTWVRLSNGDGTYADRVAAVPALLDQYGSYPLFGSSLPADVTGDGRPELAAVVLNSVWEPDPDDPFGWGRYKQVAEVEVWGLGADGRPAPARGSVELPSDGWNGTPLAGDVDGDGADELLFRRVNYDTGLVELLTLTREAGGTWRADVTVTDWASEWAGPAPAVAADVNGDGRADLVAFFDNTADTAAPGVMSRTALGKAGGGFTFTAPVNHGETAAVFGSPPAAADVTGDGRADVLFVYRDAAAGTFYARVLAGQADGRLGAFQGGPLPAPAAFADYPATVGRVDGDARADFVLLADVAGTGMVARAYTSNGDGTFAEAVSTFGDGKLPAPVGGDFDGDGKVDFAFGGRGIVKAGDVTVRTRLSSRPAAGTAWELVETASTDGADRTDGGGGNDVAWGGGGADTHAIWLYDDDRLPGYEVGGDGAEVKDGPATNVVVTGGVPYVRLTDLRVWSQGYVYATDVRTLARTADDRAWYLTYNGNLYSGSGTYLGSYDSQVRWFAVDSTGGPSYERALPSKQYAYTYKYNRSTDTFFASNGSAIYRNGTAISIHYTLRFDSLKLDDPMEYRFLGGSDGEWSVDVLGMGRLLNERGLGRGHHVFNMARSGFYSGGTFSHRVQAWEEARDPSWAVMDYTLTGSVITLLFHDSDHTASWNRGYSFTGGAHGSGENRIYFTYWITLPTGW